VPDQTTATTIKIMIISLNMINGVNYNTIQAYMVYVPNDVSYNIINIINNTSNKQHHHIDDGGYWQGLRTPGLILGLHCRSIRYYSKRTYRPSM
jgi:hypothetical protein